VSSLGEHVAPMVISSMILGLREMSILTVGEMLAMFTSSKASGAGIGLLNHSIFPDEMKSFVSIAHMEPWLRGLKDSYERKIFMWWSAFHGKSGVVSSLRISSSQWKMREYRGSGEGTLVIVTA
jgi:hypothetical protein